MFNLSARPGYMVGRRIHVNADFDEVVHYGARPRRMGGIALSPAP